MPAKGDDRSSSSLLLLCPSTLSAYAGNAGDVLVGDDGAQSPHKGVPAATFYGKRCPDRLPPRQDGTRGSNSDATEGSKTRGGAASKGAGPSRLGAVGRRNASRNGLPAVRRHAAIFNPSEPNNPC